MSLIDVSIQVPTWEEMIEFEREVTLFFNWDLKIPIPLNFVMSYLSNGVVFN
jgi:hypothetical protein